MRARVTHFPLLHPGAPARARGREIPAALVLVASLLLSSPARAYLPPRYGGVTTVPLLDLPATLDPTRASRESELQVILLLFDPLFRLSPAGKPVPHLVEPKPECSADGRTWKLRLRPGILLHNGQTLSAAQVAESLNRVRRSPTGYLLAPVRSIAAEGMDIVIQLDRPTRELPWLLSAPATGIAVRHRGRWIGSGPFKLKVWTTTGLDLLAHRAHFAGRPYLDEVRFRVFGRASAEVASFQVGTLQLSFHGTSVFGSQPRHPFTTVTSRVRTLVYLGVGRGRPHLSDPQFRLALLKGIDRRRLGRRAGTGGAEVADSPVCQRLLRVTTRPVPFDRDGATRLLGRLVQRYPTLPRDAASGRPKLDLLVDASRIEDRDVATQLVADLDRIGITVTIDAQQAKAYQARLERGRYELVLGRHPGQIPLGPVTFAGALAAAGMGVQATACMTAGRCGTRQQALDFMKQLPVIPLVHTAARLDHDARLGDLRLTYGSAVDYADVFWTRTP